ncbi:MAG TPA: hypothetical protein VJB57_04505 [Dehalococcoidia bacterium]|nr:hypothetical protein [Dehalococcoidia bacterium]
MMAVSDDEKVEVLEEVLEKLDEIAHSLRSLGDPEIEAYCLADFEGREHGWLGEFVRDILERKLREYRDGPGDGSED